MTREKAIELAVRRVARQQECSVETRFSPLMQSRLVKIEVRQIIRSWNAPTEHHAALMVPVKAIRRHFAVICRQYQVQPTASNGEGWGPVWRS